ncbi:MAG: HD domain-containing protein [Bacteroidetes bacterium]|nr:HD domain-containing protein [Bacteroidota bacterium]
MSDPSAKKTDRFKSKLLVKELQLEALLDITNSINFNFSTLAVIEKYKHFVKDQLKIEKLVLFSKFARWRCLLDYGLEEGELDTIDVERDLIHLKEITSVVSIQIDALKDFDMVVPVYQGEKPLAYLLLGDASDEENSVSGIIKHLNFLQLLTNICVSAIENQRLAKEVLKKEQEQRKMIEEQNEKLEGLVLIRTQDLQLEKEESERLLNNILPKEIAIELKRNGSVAPKGYEDASVLFTDFKGFTAASAKITPQELVGELNDIFKAFDFIMEKHGLEKIKTIGDAYMAACGIPQESKTHAIQCVRAAFDMIAYLEKRKETAEIKWEMRVGIHSGSIVAGVVGTLKFTYDVWGDAVNTASRMESNGEPGRINISENAYNHVKDFFECEYRGKLAAKGKGEIDMYFVNREIISERLINVKDFILDKLEKELPNDLYYHGYHHTIDVFEAASAIALREDIGVANIELVKVAALFHDSGFIKQYKVNEPVGCEIAKDFLPSFNYTNEEIEKICGMIMATQVPQNPQNHLEQIICDADLDYLGRADFLPIGTTLFQELNGHGMEMNLHQWNEMQVKFLTLHKYFTETARKMRDTGKQKQLDKIKSMLKFDSELKELENKAQKRQTTEE